MEISVEINGQSRRFAGPLTVLGALGQLGMAERRGIAVAIQDEVVPRAHWAGRFLVDGDRVLVIQATQGG